MLHIPVPLPRSTKVRVGFVRVGFVVVVVVAVVAVVVVAVVAVAVAPLPPASPLLSPLSDTSPMSLGGVDGLWLSGALTNARICKKELGTISPKVRDGSWPCSLLL
jgi:hypothetical protein